MMMNSKGEILIRGENSLRNEGSSAPLWVVDGNVLPTENYVGFSLNNPTIDILSHIDVDDIATIAILKGSQGAIYGSKGAGGAIIITTRSKLKSNQLMR